MHYGESLVSVFRESFTSNDRIFISGEDWALDNNSMKFFVVFAVFPEFLKSHALSRLEAYEATRIYKFDTNNHVSHHLWWKENFLNHQKVSSHYEQNCLQNFLLLFFSLSTTLIVQNSHAWSGIHFIFFKKHCRPNMKSFQFEIWISAKRSEKQLSTMTNFSARLQIICFNFRLKLCQRP